MLERTESEWGPWTIVEATDRYWTRIAVFETIIRATEGGAPKSAPRGRHRRMLETLDLGTTSFEGRV